MGPKIDVKLVDAIGRLWQLSTVQFDFTLPRRFELEYVADDGKKHQPLMVHRALYGSIERFFGILIEHYAGAFPVWLAPVQAVVLPITDRHAEYAQKVVDQLKDAGMRVELDDRKEKVNLKIREAQLQKVPYMLVVGDREAQERQCFGAQPQARRSGSAESGRVRGRDPAAHRQQSPDGVRTLARDLHCKMWGLSAVNASHCHNYSRIYVSTVAHSIRLHVNPRGACRVGILAGPTKRSEMSWPPKLSGVAVFHLVSLVTLRVDQELDFTIANRGFQH